MMAERILRLPDVMARTGLSRSTIYSMIAEGGFPDPIRLTSRCVGWLESELADWLAERAAARHSRESAEEVEPGGLHSTSRAGES